MTVLDRATLIATLQDLLAGKHDGQQAARWAFDQFYGEEEGQVEYEPGYQRIIMRALDDLMFGDNSQFQLQPAAVEVLVQALEAAPFDPNETNNDDDDELG